MQWGQIKTLLIVSFLVLDIYLLFQVMEKREDANIGILEQNPSTIEEQLKAEGITYNELSEQVEETYISVQQRSFDIDELTNLEQFRLQKTHFLSKYLLLSMLDKPVKISSSDTKETITDVFKAFGYFAEEYTFWDWNKELNIIMFFQEKSERPIYYNPNGLVLLFLNDDNEVVYYTQTLLGKTESLGEKKKLMEPIRAIEILYEANELHSGDEVTKISGGFHTRIPFDSGVQVFAPIWKVKVNESTDYFINAIEGFIFSSNERDFLMEVLESIIERINENGEKPANFNNVLEDLDRRLQLIES